MSDPSDDLFQNYLRHYKDSGTGRLQVPYHEVKSLYLDRLPRWLDRISHEACILDAGCASGYLLGLFWSSGYRNLVGVELSEQLAGVARQNLSSEVKIVISDISEYLKTVPDESFDLILFHHVLEHIPRELTIPLLREFHRVLKPGGYLNLKVPNASYLLAGNHMFGDFTHVVHFNEHSILQVLEVAGFGAEYVEFVQRPPRLYWSWRRLDRAFLRVVNRGRWHLHGLLHKMLCLVVDQHPIPKIFEAELETLVRR